MHLLLLFHYVNCLFYHALTLRQHLPAKLKINLTCCQETYPDSQAEWHIWLVRREIAIVLVGDEMQRRPGFCIVIIPWRIYVMFSVRRIFIDGWLAPSKSAPGNTNLCDFREC